VIDHAEQRQIAGRRMLRAGRASVATKNYLETEIDL